MSYWSSIPKKIFTSEDINSHSDELSDGLEWKYDLGDELVDFYNNYYNEGNITNKFTLDYLLWSMGDIKVGIVCCKNTLVGVISGRICTLRIDGEEKKCINISNMVIHPDYRNRKLAPILMTKAYKEGCKLTNLPILMFSKVGDDNFPGEYAKCIAKYIPINTSKTISADISTPKCNSFSLFHPKKYDELTSIQAIEIVKTLPYSLLHIPEERDFNQPFIKIIGNDKECIVMAICNGYNRMKKIEYSIGYIHLVVGDEVNLLNSILNLYPVDIIQITNPPNSYSKYTNGHLPIHIHLLNIDKTIKNSKFFLF